MDYFISYKKGVFNVTLDDSHITPTQPVIKIVFNRPSGISESITKCVALLVGEDNTVEVISKTPKLPEDNTWYAAAILKGYTENGKQKNFKAKDIEIIESIFEETEISADEEKIEWVIKNNLDVLVSVLEDFSIPVEIPKIKTAAKETKTSTEKTSSKKTQNKTSRRGPGRPKGSKNAPKPPKEPIPKPPPQKPENIDRPQKTPASILDLAE